jgi:hypothetical protein
LKYNILTENNSVFIARENIAGGDYSVTVVARAYAHKSSVSDAFGITYKLFADYDVYGLAGFKNIQDGVMTVNGDGVKFNIHPDFANGNLSYFKSPDFTADFSLAPCVYMDIEDNNISFQSRLFYHNSARPIDNAAGSSCNLVTVTNAVCPSGAYTRKVTTADMTAMGVSGKAGTAIVIVPNTFASYVIVKRAKMFSLTEYADNASVQLTAPTGLRQHTDGSSIAWDADNTCDGYNVTVKDAGENVVARATAYYPYYQVAALPAGEYTISVCKLGERDSAASDYRFRITDLQNYSAQYISNNFNGTEYNANLTAARITYDNTVDRATFNPINANAVGGGGNDPRIASLDLNKKPVAVINNFELRGTAWGIRIVHAGTAANGLVIIGDMYGAFAPVTTVVPLFVNGQKATPALLAGAVTNFKAIVYSTRGSTMSVSGIRYVIIESI